MIMKCNRRKCYCSMASWHNNQYVFDECRFFEREVELIDKKLKEIGYSYRMSADRFLEELEKW